MKFLASFVRKSLYQDFCLPELISICQMLKVPLTYDNKYSYNVDLDPVIHIDIPDLESSGTAQLICDRAVLTKNIIKIIAEGNTYEELLDKIDKESIMEELESPETFKFEVDPRGKVMSQNEKVDVIEKFDKFYFKGKVDLKNPNRVFMVIDNHYRGSKYFGKLVGGKSDDEQKFYSKYNLSSRKYLGPTSTDNVLAFIMCNLGQTKAADFVLDPFVGTGSLLIPPSHFSAICFGCDIDIRVLKGYSIGYTKKEKDKTTSKESNIFTNFTHYNLPSPQILREDINHPCFRKSEIFDSIICDPPYGHRAFTRKTGMESDKKVKRDERLKRRQDKNKDKENINLETNSNSISGTKNGDEININFTKDIIEKKENKVDSYFFAPLKQCSIENIFENLLFLGNQCLRSGGLLVCLYPTKIQKGDEDIVHLPANFPQNKNFQLIYAIENAYSKRKSRWCLVYQKN